MSVGKKVRIISLGEFNKKLIYPILGAISKFITEYILGLSDDDLSFNSHSFIIGINSGFGMSLAIIPYLYTLNNSKVLEKGKLINNVYFDQFLKKNNPSESKKKFILLFLCAFLDFIQKILSFLLNHSLTNNLWIFNIIFLNVFTSIITSNQLYRHQYFSSGIMILFGILLNVINLNNMKSGQIPMLILNILIEIIYSLGIVLAKYGMDDFFCSPFEITFYEGIFCLFFNIIFLIISTNIPIPFEKIWYFSKLFKISEYNGKKYLDNFYTYIDEISLKEILLFFVHMITRASFNLFSHITIKYYTSSHLILILILGEILLSLKEKNIRDKLIAIGIFIVEFIMVLIFLEIIELNFCGFEKNTRKNIKERAISSTIDDDYGRDSKEICEGIELNTEVSSSINENG